MATKRKFKRDYIILEAKDINFRYSERALPKAFAKVEINEEKSVVALYVENLKCVKEGYRVVAIQSDYETLELGNIVLSEQGKGEFVLNLDRNDIEIKGIAMLHEKQVPLIGFKGSKIDNYEEILFAGEEEYEEDYRNELDDEDDAEYEYEEIEYIEIDEDDDDVEYEYEEIEYIEIDEDDDDVEYSRGDSSDEEYVEINNQDDEVEENEEVEESKTRKLEYIQTQEKIKPQQKQTDKYLKYKEKQLSNSKKYIKAERKEAQSQSDSYESMKTAGTLLMPRQIKKGLKQFREVKPFIEEPVENTRWWKIEINPLTLSGYAMPNLGYVNTLNYTMYSDTVMNSYKYRHYLFGVQYDEYNKRKNYIYAIPGKKDEQPDKGHTGFTTYQPCDTRNDKLGYWLCFIDSRTRKILK